MLKFPWIGRRNLICLFVSLGQSSGSCESLKIFSTWKDCQSSCIPFYYIRFVVCARKNRFVKYTLCELTIRCQNTHMRWNKIQRFGEEQNWAREEFSPRLEFVSSRLLLFSQQQTIQQIRNKFHFNSHCAESNDGKTFLITQMKERSLKLNWKMFYCKLGDFILELTNRICGNQLRFRAIKMKPDFQLKIYF